MSVTVANGSSTNAYQWQSSSSVGGPFSNISGASNSSYTPPSGTAGTTYYQAVITASGNDCQSVTSNVATVVVRPDLSITAQPTNIDECVGGTNQLSVTVANGSGTIAYQWQSSSSASGPFSNISGATSSTYTPPSTSEGSRDGKECRTRWWTDH